MLPPPGITPTSLFENVTPTAISSAIATTSSILNISTDIPFSTTALIIATATAIASANGQKEHSPPASPPDNGECSLLGPFAIFVQGALGLFALLALVYKRWRERPQRPMKIWFFDASKQVVGSVLVHIANLLMSMLSSGQLSIKLDASSVAGARRRDVDAQGNYRPNPCSFYLLNLAIDTTIGIPILILLLRILTALFSMTPLGNPPESIQSGNYGTPPRTYWWFKQSIIYFIGLMGMKFCVLIIFLVCPWISRIGDWALGWTEGDEVLQVIFVMLVFPVIMNATQYYIIDSFIKNQKPEHERIPDEDADTGSFDHSRDGDAYVDPLESRSSDEIHSEDESDLEVVNKTDNQAEAKSKAKRGYSSGSGGKRQEPLKTGSKDYNPLFDGESSPTVVGSASTGSSERLVQTETDSDVTKGSSR